MSSVIIHPVVRYLRCLPCVSVRRFEQVPRVRCYNPKCHVIFEIFQHNLVTRADDINYSKQFADFKQSTHWFASNHPKHIYFSKGFRVSMRSLSQRLSTATFFVSKDFKASATWAEKVLFVLIRDRVGKQWQLWDLGAEPRCVSLPN